MSTEARDDLEFDPDALRDRYRHERDKRLRAEANEQYIEVAGDYAHYLEDPYIEAVEREPLRDDVTVVLIGGGFAGMVAGAWLKQAGVDDIRIIEKGGDFGGTWYWNRYPGAQCDVESYIYLPFLEETGYVPTEKYVHAPEILDHCHRIATHFGLYDNACLSTEVTGLEWDRSRSCWIIRTNRDDEMTARFVVMGTGPLHRPKLPGLLGIETFRGHSFHTSRWDYEYTGGDSNGNLSKLADKKVAIIGTGATSVQAVPHLAEAAEQLYVFQRTPSSIDVRANRPTDAAWAAALQPDWQRKRRENFTILTSGGIAEEDLVMDGWTDIIGRLVARLREQRAAGYAGDDEFSPMEMADFEKMEQIRSRVDEIIEDAGTAAALKPWYRQFCKRPCFHDEYLQAFNRPNVTLVDTDGRGVERVTENGLVARGIDYNVDCIIYATGFEVGTDYTRRAGYDIVGADGILLSEHRKSGMRSVHGMHVHGFPNMFIIGHTQGGFTANYPHLVDEASSHVAHIVASALDGGVRELEATSEAEDEWLQALADNARNVRAFQEQCTPGYYNNEGRPADGGFIVNSYGKGPLAFFKLLAEWREAATYPGFEVRY